MRALVVFRQRTVQLDALPSHAGSGTLHLPGDQQHCPRVACHTARLAQIARAVTTLDKKQQAAVLGRNPETTDQARVRLEQGNTIGWNLDGLTRAIGQIQGVSQNRVYFNFDPLIAQTLPGGITVNPRHILMIIAGSDSTGTTIASTYAELMNAPTDGSLSQPFTYANGQVISVYYRPSTTGNLYVKLFYDSNTTPDPGYLGIADTILSAVPFIIGEVVSTETILTALAGFQYASLVDAQVSTNGITWVRKITYNADQIPGVVSVVGASA